MTEMVRCVPERSGLLRLVPAFLLRTTFDSIQQSWPESEGIDLNCLYFKFRGWSVCFWQTDVRNGQF